MGWFVPGSGRRLVCHLEVTVLYSLRRNNLGCSSMEESPLVAHVDQNIAPWTHASTPYSLLQPKPHSRNAP